MRRKDREITDLREIDLLMRRFKVCHIAMVDDGQPYVVPMSYGYDGESIYLHSAREGRKIDILRRNGRVCFEMSGDYRPPNEELVCVKATKYSSVIGYGSVVFIDEKDEKLRGLDIIMEQQYGPGSRSYPSDAVDDLVVIRIMITELTGKGIGHRSD